MVLFPEHIALCYACLKIGAIFAPIDLRLKDHEVKRDLDKIEHAVKLTVFVNSAVGFHSQPKVANGASEFLVQLLGDAGKHARSAVGVNELPLNSPVEIEMIVKVK